MRSPIGSKKKTRQLERELHTLQVKLSETEAATARQGGELQDQLAALQIQLGQKDEQLQESFQRCAEEAARADALAADMVQLEEDLNSSYNSTLDQMIKQISDLESRLTEKESEQAQGGVGLRINENRVGELELENTELKRQLQRASEELDGKNTELQSLNTRIETFQEEMADQEDFLNTTYSNSLELMVEQISNLKSRLAESELDVETQQVTAVDTETNDEQIKLLQAELVTKDQQIQELASDLEEMEESLNKSYSESLDTMVKQISDLKGLLATSNQNIEKLKQTAKEADERSETLAAQTSEKDDRIKQLQEEMEDMETQLNKSYSDTLDQMVRQVSQLKLLLTESNKENEALRRTNGSVTGSDSENARLEQQIAVLSSEVLEKDTKIKEITAEMEDLEEQLNKSYSETLDQLVKQIDTLKRQATVSKQQRDSTEARNVELEQKVAELSSTITKKEENANRLEMVNSDFHTRTPSLHLAHTSYVQSRRPLSIVNSYQFAAMSPKAVHCTTSSASSSIQNAPCTGV